MLDHLGIQCADLPASAAFYDAVLAPLGATRLMDFGVAIGFGIPPKPDFWIGQFDSGDGFRESHIAFVASDRATVRAFFDAAVAAGAEVLHEPRLWPEYHAEYYGAFVRDPDGNNVEAVCHSPEPPDAMPDRGGLIGQCRRGRAGRLRPAGQDGHDLAVVDLARSARSRARGRSASGPPTSGFQLVVSRRGPPCSSMWRYTRCMTWVA